MRRSAAFLTAFALIAAAPAVGDAPSPAGGPLPDSTLCDPMDPAQCLLPLPNDHFTVAAETATGRQAAINTLATPRNVEGKPIDMTDWNRQDGWSPGSMLLTFVPDLDLSKTWDSEIDHIADPGRYLDADAPMVIIDVTTGERHPFWSELDFHPETTADERLLIIRPLINFREGHRYVVALRDLEDGAGRTIPAGEAFAHYRDGTAPLVPDPAFEARRPRMEAILATLAEHDIDGELFLAWDFTVASADNLAGRVLHMRDEAFAALGDDDLADLVPAGASPDFTITSVEQDPDGDTSRRIHGTVTVPNYIDRPPTPIGGEQIGGELPNQTVPLGRLNYGADGLPEPNPAIPTLEAAFVCNIPKGTTSAAPSPPSLYGHGLLGSRRESNGSSAQVMTEQQGMTMCGVDWIGMAEQDIANVALLLQDVSHFPSMPDRAQQGFLNFLFVGRAVIHPDGLSTDAAFRDEGGALIDIAELFYDGNSQGGIMGGALVALAPDFTKAVLGVPGMNYSTLLHRSVDWEGYLSETEPLEVGYGPLFYAFYPGKQEQLVAMHLMQMLWDRAEANGYAQHMTDEPYDNTPAHQVLFHPAYGDYQVANVSAEVMARTAGARLLDTSLSANRHWAPDMTFGFDVFDRDVDGAILPWNGSALVYWDSGNPVPPNANVPPAALGQDPHSDPRKDPRGGAQKGHFYRTGEIIDVFGGAPYCSYRFPRHPDDIPPAGCAG